MTMKSILLSPFFLVLYLTYLEKEKIFIGTLTNNSDKTIYFKDVFPYYRFDYLDDLSETFVSFSIKSKTGRLYFKGEPGPSKLGKGFDNPIILDKHSKVYYDKASSRNFFNTVYLQFDNKFDIMKKCVSIPLEPGDSFKFLIPADLRVWEEKTYMLPETFKTGEDSLCMFLTVDLPVSEVKSQNSNYYKSQIVRSDTIWFKPK